MSLITTEVNKIFPKTSMTILGYGIIARSFLNVLDKILKNKIKVTVVDRNFPDLKEEFQNIKINFQEIYINEKNFEEVLNKICGPQSLCLNFSTHIASFDVAKFCSKNAIHYLDTASNSWSYETLHKSLSQEKYGEALVLFKKKYIPSSSFIIFNFGMNPGLVSFLAKSLLDRWLLSSSGQNSISIRFTEIDQLMPDISTRKEEHFSNSWSLEGLTEEFLLPAEYILNDMVKNSRLAIESPKNFQSAFDGIINGFIVPHREVLSVYEWCKKNHSNISIEEVSFIYSPNSNALNFVRKNTAELKKRSDKYHLFYRNNYNNKWSRGFNEVCVQLETKERILYEGFRLDVEDDICRYYKSNPTALFVSGAALIGLVIAFKNNLNGIFESEDLFGWFDEVRESSIELFGQNARFQI